MTAQSRESVMIALIAVLSSSISAPPALAAASAGMPRQPASEPSFLYR